MVQEDNNEVEEGGGKGGANYVLVWKVCRMDGGVLCMLLPHTHNSCEAPGYVVQLFPLIALSHTLAWKHIFNP